MHFNHHFLCGLGSKITVGRILFVCTRDDIVKLITVEET
jgi:hypothetical protein